MNEPLEVYDVKFMRGLVRRRKKIFLAVFSVVFLASVILALLTPKAYISTATILIEGQVTEDILKGVSSSGFIEERLQAITQQMLSRDKLLEIIKQLNLYPELTDKDVESATDDMRKNITIRTIKAEDLDKRPSRTGYSTVAFTLSFQGQDPVMVQKVASRLTALYIEKDLQVKGQVAAQTTAILQQRLHQSKEYLDLLGSRISDFKRQHAGELPESMPFNLEQIYRLNSQLEEVNGRIRILEGGAASSEGVSPQGSGNQSASDPWARLAQLHMQVVNLQSRYSDKHPDLVKARSEIKQLETRLGISVEQSEKAKRLDELKNRRDDLINSLGPDHPEVAALSKEINTLSSEVQKSKDSGNHVKSRESELKKYIRQRDEIQRKINELNRKNQMAPITQSEYSKLTLEYDAAAKQYNDTMNKLAEAKMAKGVEETKIGERFTIIDEPAVPQKPEKPKQKLKILMAGFFMSIIGGFFSALIMENLDHSIKSMHQLQKITKSPVLAILPYIKSEDEEAEGKFHAVTKKLDDFKNYMCQMIEQGRKKLRV